MPGLVKEFKEFISRGNVIDLAVAVVIGAAFKPLNALQQRRRRGQEPVDEVELSDEAALLTEIRDLLAVQGPAGVGRANPGTPPAPSGIPPAGGA